MKNILKTPVVLIIFNRPNTTEIVFKEIAKAKPEILFVIADGPRPNYPEDVEKCAATRRIIDKVNWKCEIIKNYSDENLGCWKRVPTGISWVFDNVEEAIIFEDDCRPNQSFFKFCEKLLDEYRDDERVMQICGNNFQLKKVQNKYSYFFSNHNICWGWATWRRAWEHYDIGVKLWPALKKTSWLINLVKDYKAYDYWADKFTRAFENDGNIGTWDYQWTFACWAQHGLSILPNTTLVSNIGFGENATHTKKVSKIAYLPTEKMYFPLKHPPYMIRNMEADEHFIEQLVLPLQIKHYRNLRRRFISSLIPQFAKKPISYYRSKWIGELK